MDVDETGHRGQIDQLHTFYKFRNFNIAAN